MYLVPVLSFLLPDFTIFYSLHLPHLDVIPHTVPQQGMGSNNHRLLKSKIMIHNKLSQFEIAFLECFVCHRDGKLADKCNQIP